MAEVVTEIGCGLGGDRRNPSTLLPDRLMSTIVAEQWDQVARFGVGATG